jgi:hypothetical protein
MPDPATKRCARCGQDKSLSEFHTRADSPDGYRGDCRACRTEQERQRYRVNREAKLEYQRRYYQDKSPAILAYQRRYRETSRVIVFAHYGEQCACCGTTDNLTIDHVNGDGARHRQKLYGDPQRGTFYHWLIKQGFPDGFQTLCFPCNASKKNSLRCRLDHTRQET